MKMFEKKRQHPAAILTNTIANLRATIYPIILALIIGNSGEGDRIEELVLRIIIPIGLLFLNIVQGFISWWRFTYRLEDGELRIESGLLFKKKRFIPFERIQSISVSQGIIQRMFGLVKMSFETAGGLETEAELAAIPRREAKEIEDYVKRAKKNLLIEDASIVIELEHEGKPLSQKLEKPVECIYSMNFQEVFLVALTSGGAIGVIVGILAFLSEIGDIIPINLFYDEAKALLASGILILIVTVLVVILLAYVIAIIRSVLKFANFKVEWDEENIMISHGVLEKKKTTVPLKRIQGIVIDENLIRGLFGYATVYILNAGGSSVETGVDGRIMICPFIKKDRISTVITRCLPDYKIDVSYTPVPKRAKPLYILRSIFSFRIAVAILLCVYFLKPWGLLSLFLIPLGAILGYIKFTFAGWSLTGEQLALRDRFLTKRTTYMLKRRIQSLEVSQSYFQRLQKVSTISGTVMSGFAGLNGKAVHIDEEDARFLYRWFSLEKDEPVKEELTTE